MAKPPSRLGRGLGSLISGGTAPVNKPSTPVDSVPLPTETTKVFVGKELFVPQK